MWRIFVEPAPLFVMAVLATTAYFFVRRRYPVGPEHWSNRAIPLLLLFALAAVATAILALGLFADRHEGAYVPARIENGRLVPGGS